MLKKTMFSFLFVILLAGFVILLVGLGDNNDYKKNDEQMIEIDKAIENANSLEEKLHAAFGGFDAFQKLPEVEKDKIEVNAIPAPIVRIKGEMGVAYIYHYKDRGYGISAVKVHYSDLYKRNDVSCYRIRMAGPNNMKKVPNGIIAANSNVGIIGKTSKLDFTGNANLIMKILARFNQRKSVEKILRKEGFAEKYIRNMLNTRIPTQEEVDKLYRNSGLINKAPFFQKM